MVTALYVHLPFCRQRCLYCDFPIVVAKANTPPNSPGSIGSYIEILIQEITKTPILGGALDTVFFGGGTPSLIPVPDLGEILTAIDHHWGIAPGAEISMEIDPGTFDQAQLQGYKDLGVNRYSLGAQSFDDQLLERCGRFHRLKDIYSAITIINRVGIANFSLDVISGLPDQTLPIWEDTLKMAVDFNPPHISSYDLVIEEVTPFGRQYQPGELPLPSDDDTAAMYKLASSYLQAAGYEHYEISNYGRSGYQCRHNRVYWENRPYYAIGMGAASYTNGQRFVRPRRRQDYFKWVETYQGHLEEPPLTDHDRILESLMLGLRLREGVTLTQYPQPIQDRITQTVQPFIKEHWVEINRDRLKLTDPDGFLFSNVVLSELFKELEP